MDLLYGRLDAAVLAHASECAALTVEIGALRKALHNYHDDDDDDETKRQHLLKDPPPHVQLAPLNDAATVGRPCHRFVEGAPLALPLSLECKDDGQVRSVVVVSDGTSIH